MRRRQKKSDALSKFNLARGTAKSPYGKRIRKCAAWILHHTCAQSYFASVLEISGFLAKLIYAVAYVLRRRVRFAAPWFCRFCAQHCRGSGLSLSASARWLGLSLPSRCQRSRSAGRFLWNIVIIPKNRSGLTDEIWQMLIAANMHDEAAGPDSSFGYSNTNDEISVWR